MSKRILRIDKEQHKFLLNYLEEGKEEAIVSLVDHSGDEKKKVLKDIKTCESIIRQLKSIRF